MKTSVVIPNWQGEKLLEKNLPYVLAIGADEVIVVEDASTDGSLQLLQTKFPQIKVIIHTQNKGFVAGVNEGFNKAQGDIVFLLNTDVTPRTGLKEAVLKHFARDKDLFAVSFNEEKEWGAVKGIFYKGLIEHRPGLKPDKEIESFWASGGSAAYDRKKWIALGGMRMIYAPFYWEDLDIGYRAWKAGWRILWDANSRALHELGGTIKKNFAKKKIDRTVKRNQILFFWINISSLSMWFYHILWLPVRMILYGYFVPVLWAILKMPRVLAERLKNKGEELSDEQILNKFKD